MGAVRPATCVIFLNLYSLRPSISAPCWLLSRLDKGRVQAEYLELVGSMPGTMRYGYRMSLLRPVGKLDGTQTRPSLKQKPLTEPEAMPRKG